MPIFVHASPGSNPGGVDEAYGADWDKFVKWMTNYVSKTATYTASIDDLGIACNCTSGAITINLPTAIGEAGKKYMIWKTDSSGNAVTIDPFGTQTINGATTYTLPSQYSIVSITSDGANWIITNASGGALGEANLGANVGSGAGTFRDKTGVTLNFRRLLEGLGIDMTENADDITVAVSSIVALTNAANTYNAGAKQTVEHSSTTAGLKINPHTGDPSVTVDGDVWYNSTLAKFRKKQGGVITDLDTGSTGAPDISGVVYVDAGGLGDYTSLSAAVAAQGNNKKYVLAPGTYSLTSKFNPTAPTDIWIEGSGAGSTILSLDTGIGATLSGFATKGSIGGNVPLTATTPLTKGTRVLTVASTTGFLPDDWIWLQRDVQVDAGATRYDGEFQQILTVDSATQITLTANVYEDYTTANSADLYKVTFAENIKISDLTIEENRTSVTDTDDFGDVAFHWCKNLILENLEIINPYRAGIVIHQCMGVSVDKVFIDRPQEHTGSGDGIRYGFYVTSSTTNCVITNSTGNRCRHFMTTNTLGTGNKSGRRRGLALIGCKSYNADTAAFDTHQSDVGVAFIGCSAISQYPNGATTDTQCINLRSPAQVIGCTFEGAYKYMMSVWQDGDVAGSLLQPGADRTTIMGCRFHYTRDSSGGRGIHIQDNRANIEILGNIFTDMDDQAIYIEDGCNNIDISHNQFVSCGAGLGSSAGVIQCLGTCDDLTVKDNKFTGPSASCKPLYIASASVRGLFVGNGVNAFTGANKSPGGTITGFIIQDNPALVTKNGGTSTQNGTGAQTVFNIAHGLAVAPTVYNVTPGHADAKGDFYVTADATNLIVTYGTAPASGTNNVVLRWRASVYEV